MDVRFATVQDAPAIYGIVQDHLEKLINDGEVFTPEMAVKATKAREFLVFTDTVDGVPDYPVGGVWLDGQVQDLRIDLHLAIRPEYLRKILKQKMLNKGIDLIFSHYNVKKICFEFALIIDKRRNLIKGKTSAFKLMKVIGAKQVGFHYKHLYFQGKPHDLYQFALTKRYWRENVSRESAESERLQQPSSGSDNA